MRTREPVKIIDDFFTIPQGRDDILKAPESFPPSVYT